MDNKYYYKNLGAVPFAEIYVSDIKIEKLPKYWKEITEEEAKTHENIEEIPNID